MRELLGRVEIAGVMHARYPSATRTPCGIASDHDIKLFGQLTCPTCSVVAPVWDEIDRKPSADLPSAVCTESKSSYAAGCRCEACKAAQSLYQRDYRRGIRIRAPKVNPRCGTLSGYSRPCRCDACREAKRVYDRARYLARRQQVAA